MPNGIRQISYLGARDDFITLVITAGSTAYLKKLCAAHVKQDSSNGVNGYE